MAEHPDRTVEAHLAACPHCAADFPAARQTPQEVYDRIELPPVKPDVTRVHLFGGRCTCCGQRATATAPAASNPARRSAARSRPWWSTCIAQAVGLERLRAVMAEVFGLSISEGALCNTLARARAPLTAAVEPIRDSVVASRVVCSDETSVRVAGRTWWEWVFVTGTGVLHLIRPRVVPPCRAQCSAACSPACGCRTRSAASAAMPGTGRCA